MKDVQCGVCRWLVLGLARGLQIPGSIWMDFWYVRYNGLTDIEDPGMRLPSAWMLGNLTDAVNHDCMSRGELEMIP